MPARNAIYREYRNDAGQAFPSGALTNRQLLSDSGALGVRVSDVRRALDARAAALAVGPENVGDLQFRLSESAPARLQAYRAAVQDAAARARIAAEGGGAPLGRLLVLQEGQGPCIGRAVVVAAGTRMVRQDLRRSSPVTTVGAEIEVAVTSRTLRLEH
ncbi:MAG: SIMPL domain-containing protein [Caulobacteraceae bacterium]|nr:SIMPL domain-containing protein [Caulobacteraceae bacterium]